MCLSGGKDSTALALHMRDRIPEMEYIFTDTGKELKETYEYLQRVEAFLGKSIKRLNSDRTFDHWMKIFGNYLPSTRMRWCTKELKIRPLEKYIGNTPTYMYVGIRADEDREGYISSKENIIPIFPFKEEGITKEDVMRILEESGIGLPDYYSWRTRSGCYFCFFQRKREWVGLMDEHPDLFEKAKEYEKIDPKTGKKFTWSQSESLEELSRPERVAEIREKHEQEMGKAKKQRPNSRLVQILGEALDEDDDESPCLICHL